jgi:hypothetical protein
MGKSVQRDVGEGHSTEDSEQFEPEVEDRDHSVEEEILDAPHERLEIATPETRSPTTGQS